MNDKKDEDLKQIRKLRKTLRQIENLQLLNRNLNDEEKLKVSKRSLYRKQLLELNSKFGEDELNSSDNTTFNTNDSVLSNEGEFLSNSELEIKSEKNDSPRIDAITEQLTKLAINESLNQSNTKNESNKTEKASESNENYTKSEDIKNENSKKQANKKQNIKEETLIPKFEITEITEAHNDLITTLDISEDGSLLVTGSRDTTIKVWNIDSEKKICSFGGHTSTVTCAKFWPLKYYKQSLQNILLKFTSEDTEYEDAEQMLERLNDTENDNYLSDYPLIVSTSLDCSFRIWIMGKYGGICLKEFYLYNRINNFDFDETSFVFALDGGKIDYYVDTLKKSNIKPFKDHEIVTFVEIEKNKINALAHTGDFRIFKITDDTENCLELINENETSNLMKNSENQSYKQFTMLNDDNVLLLNGQFYMTSQNLKSGKCEHISNNTNTYGITTCLYKLKNTLYTAAFNIDTAESTINVFSIEPSFKYEYSFYTDSTESSSYCISTICVKPVQFRKDACLMATGSQKSFKIWKISLNKNDIKDFTAKRFKLCKFVDNTNKHKEEGDEENIKNSDNNNDSDNEPIEQEPDDTDEKPKRSCAIQ